MHFNSKMHKRLFLDLQAARAALQISTYLRKDAWFAASENIINVTGESARSTPAVAGNKIQTGVKRRGLKFQAKEQSECKKYRRRVYRKAAGV